jgi:hypothetical protein
MQPEHANDRMKKAPVGAFGALLNMEEKQTTLNEDGFLHRA